MMYCIVSHVKDAYRDIFEQYQISVERVIDYEKKSWQKNKNATYIDYDRVGKKKVWEKKKVDIIYLTFVYVEKKLIN